MTATQTMADAPFDSEKARKGAPFALIPYYMYHQIHFCVEVNVLFSKTEQKYSIKVKDSVSGITINLKK